MEQGRDIMTASSLSNNIFVGIDVGGASLDVKAFVEIVHGALGR